MVMTHCVFPTNVGINQSRNKREKAQRACSPRTWGLTAGEVCEEYRAEVFPTNVGINRLITRQNACLHSVPHERGD